MKNRNLLSAGLLLVPVACAVIALVRYSYGVHVAIPVVCAMLVGCLSPKEISRTKWLLVAALAFSIAGDWALKHRGDDVLMFVWGIALFFIAHAGFLAFCLKNGNVRWPLLALLTAGYGVFFIWKLRPAIPDAMLLTAVLLYMLISCLSLAAAPGLRLSPAARWLFTAGIACIVFSDTLIACCEFLNICGLYDVLMMPAYYAAHILIAAAVIIHHNRQPGSSHRNFSGSSGNFSESSGNLSESSGNLSESSGNLSESSGNLSESSGNLSESSGNFSGSSGNLSPSLRNIYI